MSDSVYLTQEQYQAIAAVAPSLQGHGGIGLIEYTTHVLITTNKGPQWQIYPDGRKQREVK